MWPHHLLLLLLVRRGEARVTVINDLTNHWSSSALGRYDLVCPNITEKRGGRVIVREYFASGSLHKALASISLLGHGQGF